MYAYISCKICFYTSFCWLNQLLIFYKFKSNQRPQNHREMSQPTESKADGGGGDVKKNPPY